VHFHDELPLTEVIAKTIQQARQAVHNILSDQDDRLVVVVGPCSIHDPIKKRLMLFFIVQI
jgi:3-deoxy-7-phosphoheptulonate synthase